MTLQKENFYCVKCRVKKEYVPEKLELMGSHRYSLVVECPVCHYNMFKFIAASKLKTEYSDLKVTKHKKKIVATAN